MSQQQRDNDNVVNHRMAEGSEETNKTSAALALSELFSIGGKKQANSTPLLENETTMVESSPPGESSSEEASSVARQSMTPKHGNNPPVINDGRLRDGNNPHYGANSKIHLMQQQQHQHQQPEVTNNNDHHHTHYYPAPMPYYPPSHPSTYHHPPSSSPHDNRSHSQPYSSLPPHPPPPPQPSRHHAPYHPHYPQHHHHHHHSPYPSHHHPQQPPPPHQPPHNNNMYPHHLPYPNTTYPPSHHPPTPPSLYNPHPNHYHPPPKHPPPNNPPLLPSKKPQTYSRKDKSLGLLCLNFISRYGHTSSSSPPHGIGIDAAAAALCVERRRIYDIINILESIDMVSRRCKNTYNWHGTAGLTSVFRRLQKRAVLRLWPAEAERFGIVLGMGTKSGGGEGSSRGNEEDDGGVVKEKSLGKLSQKFIQLFLVGYDVVNLSTASEKILGCSTTTSRRSSSVGNNNVSEKTMMMTEEENTMNRSGMKTKVRRLYDIANVMVSIGIIAKVGGGGGGESSKNKPSFKWDYEISVRELAGMISTNGGEDNRSEGTPRKGCGGDKVTNETIVGGDMTIMTAIPVTPNVRKHHSISHGDGKQRLYRDDDDGGEKDAKRQRREQQQQQQHLAIVSPDTNTGSSHHESSFQGGATVLYPPCDEDVERSPRI